MESDEETLEQYRRKCAVKHYNYRFSDEAINARNKRRAAVTSLLELSAYHSSKKQRIQNVISNYDSDVLKCNKDEEHYILPEACWVPIAEASWRDPIFCVKAISKDGRNIDKCKIECNSFIELACRDDTLKSKAYTFPAHILKWTINAKQMIICMGFFHLLNDKHKTYLDCEQALYIHNHDEGIKEVLHLFYTYIPAKYQKMLKAKVFSMICKNYNTYTYACINTDEENDFTCHLKMMNELQAYVVKV